MSRLALLLLLLLTGCTLTADFSNYTFGDPKLDAGKDPEHDDAGTDPGDGDMMSTPDAGHDAGPTPDPLCETAQMEGGSCDPVAICDSSTGKALCTCPEGYFDLNGDGSQCADLDECRGGAFTCDAEATCLNTAGGYDCLCNPGYVMNKSTNKCLDSCLVLLSTPGKCDTEAVCTKPDGDPVCRCPAGYMDKNGDGSDCVADAKCMALGCDPNAMCNGNDATPKCECITGYTGDGKTCTDMDECALNADDCADSAFCSNAPGGFICTCKEGSTGDGKTCTDIDECKEGTAVCSSFATCKNATGDEKYSCTCNEGYTGDGKTCDDQDECSLGKDDCDDAALCTNKPGGFDCVCRDGYTGDGKTCMDVNECSNGSATCKAGEKCVNTPGSYTCGCDAGYKKDGSGTCVDINECTEGTATCNAQTEMCKNTAGSYTCPCKAGFELNRDGACVDVDECVANTDECSANADCKNKAGSYDCTCKSGYTGNGKTCDDVNECSSSTTNACDGTRADCKNDAGSYHCVCKSGYIDGGANTSDGLGCTDKNECSLGTDDCTNSPDACVNTEGSFSCACPTYWTGTGKGVGGCTDINECSTSNGGCDTTPMATCNNVTGGPQTCACPGGYSGNGVGASGCADVDECSSGSEQCDDTPAATCANSTGSYTCSCPAGYTISGDGKSQTGCCTPDGSTEAAKPNDGKDNDCNGTIDLPVLNSNNTFPETGGAAYLGHVSIAVNTSVVGSAQLQCRHYKRSAGASGSFVNCTNPIVRTSEDAKSTTNNGAWRTEFRWKYASGALSAVSSYDYYVHNSIGGYAFINNFPGAVLTPKCPSLGVTDAQLFAVADASLKASLVGKNTSGVQLADPGAFTEGPTHTFLTNPFITVEYNPITGGYFSLFRTLTQSVNSLALYKADMLSLRHRFVISADKRYVLIRRAYPSRRTYDDQRFINCEAARFEYNNSRFATKPGGGYASFHGSLRCEVVVLNRAGAGVCLDVNAGVITQVGLQGLGVANLFGYGKSNKYMWRHLLEEDDWPGSFVSTTADRSGFRNFSEKCDTAGCDNSTYELFLPDKSVVKK